MFSFAILCVQIFFVQYAFCQTVATPTNLNNGLPSAYGPSGLGPASLAAANMGAGLAGPMMAGGIPSAAFGAMGSQGLGLPQTQMGMNAAMVANSLAAGYGTNYGGSGSGDVAVAGELPVAGTTAITGQVPMTGKVQFTGTLPAGGIVTISGQCGCGTNNGQQNAAFGAKPAYNNKPYLY